MKGHLLWPYKAECYKSHNECVKDNYKNKIVYYPMYIKARPKSLSFTHF